MTRSRTCDTMATQSMHLGGKHLEVLLFHGLVRPRKAEPWCVLSSASEKTKKKKGKIMKKINSWLGPQYEESRHKKFPFQRVFCSNRDKQQLPISPSSSNKISGLKLLLSSNVKSNLESNTLGKIYQDGQGATHLRHLWS